MKLQTSLVYSLSLALPLIVSGCRNPAKEATLEIIRMPAQQRERALSQLSPEQQLDVYVYADTKIDPPLILAQEIASNWKSTLPPVKNRLESETDGATLAGLVMILSAVSTDHCSLADREDVLSAASRAIAKIGIPYRELAEKQLREIAHPDNQLPPCR
jgi:hypothetical protein